MKKFLLLLVGYTASLTLSYSQSTSCTQTLRIARSSYEEGKLHEIPNLLKNCLGNGFSKQEQVEAYKILTLSYLYLEEPEKADEAMLGLLKTDPYFEINQTVDPAEFIALYKTFRTSPVYRIGLNIGANATQPNVIEAMKTNAGQNEYAYSASFQVGINAEIPMNNGKFTLNPGLRLQQKSFTVTSTIDRGTTATGEALSNTTTGKERQTWISLPIAVQYQLKQSRYNPFVLVGLSVDYLLRAELTAQTNQGNAGSIQEKKYEMQREPLNISVVAGGGLKFRIFGGYVITELRYSYGLTPVNSEKTAYQNINTAFNNNIGDSLFKLNSIAFTGGYVQNIFNPKKLKRRK